MTNNIFILEELYNIAEIANPPQYHYWLTKANHYTRLVRLIILYDNVWKRAVIRSILPLIKKARQAIKTTYEHKADIMLQDPIIKISPDAAKKMDRSPDPYNPIELE